MIDNKAYLADLLGNTNRYVAYTAHWRIAKFSAGTAEVLARIDCDRSYNPRHVPTVIGHVEITVRAVYIHWADGKWYPCVRRFT